MTAFFVPGTASPRAEGAYARIRETARADTGYDPQPQRIFKLSYRHGGMDVEAEVGMPDPVVGHTVLAILDLGRHSPYLIHSSSRTGSVRTTLVTKPVYAVTEFS